MEPVNYIRDVQPQVNSVMQGFQSGITMKSMLDEQKAKEAKEAQLHQMATDLNELSANPTTEGLIKNSIKYPQLSEQYKRTYDMLAPKEQQAKIDAMIPVYHALKTGRNDVASKLLHEQADALENSGNPDAAKVAREQASMTEQDGRPSQLIAGLLLSRIMGPDKFMSTFEKESDITRANDKAPAELSEANSKALKAAVDARFAESNAVQNLVKGGWDINKIQNDIEVSRENLKIANAKAIQEKMENPMKQKEMQLKIAKMEQDRDSALNEKVAGVESARSSIDNMLNTATKLLEHPGLSSAVGTVDGVVPSVMPNTVDFEALLKTFDSQKFLAQLPAMKSLGALSEKEGDKLQASLSPTALRQSEPAFRKNVSEAIRLMTIARENLAKKYGVPDTAPDTPAATEALDTRPYMRHADQGGSGQDSNTPSIAPAGDGWSIRPIGGQ